MYREPGFEPQIDLHLDYSDITFCVLVQISARRQRLSHRIKQLRGLDEQSVNNIVQLHPLFVIARTIVNYDESP